MRASLCGLVLALALVAALAAPAGAENPVRATLRASSTEPVADTAWRYVITVRDGQGKAVQAKARLQVLLGNAVVGCWRRRGLAPCRGATGAWIAFTGTRAGTVRWPPRFVGVRLTFRAIVVVDGRSLRLRVPVRVQAP